MFGCAVVLLGKQKQKKHKKINVCVFWALSLEKHQMFLMGSTKLGSVPACDSSRKSGSSSEPGQEVEQMDKLVDRQAAGSSE